MMKGKKMIFVLVALAVLIAAWFVGYGNHKSASKLPQLSEIAQMDEADVNELLVGYYRTQLPDIWGGPDPERSGQNTWVWRIDGNILLTVSSNKVGEKAKIVSTAVDSVFKAEVIKIGNGYILVKPVEGTREAASSDRIEVPLEHLEPSPELAVGDIIEITHAGDILETYPARLVSVHRIAAIE